MNLGNRPGTGSVEPDRQQPCRGRGSGLNIMRNRGGDGMAEPTVAEFASAARSWLRSTGLPERAPDAEAAWGVGPDSVAVFHDLGHDEELALVRRRAAWQRTRYAAGFGAITWPVEHGGR